jgi:RHS repeat-associated protein
MVYDAWNRLVEVRASDNSTVIAQYQYDGRNYRTVKKTYASGALAETRHFYYNSSWQCLEERLESDSVIASYADRQNVWGIRYVDDLILRDRDTDADGTLDERLYAMQDPNWNTVAIANSSGAVAERYSYTAYGKATFLTSAFAAQSINASSYNWDTLYTSRQLDSETCLYQYRNRYYEAETGRFINRDPVGYEAEDFNLYRYVGNDPLDDVDPLGLAQIKHRPVRSVEPVPVTRESIRRASGPDHPPAYPTSHFHEPLNEPMICPMPESSKKEWKTQDECIKKMNIAESNCKRRADLACNFLWGGVLPWPVDLATTQACKDSLYLGCEIIGNYGRNLCKQKDSSLPLLFAAQ